MSSIGALLASFFHLLLAQDFTFVSMSCWVRPLDAAGQ